MASQPTSQPDPQGPVLLSFGCRDTHHLLEVYVKRSLSDRSPLRRRLSTKASRFKTLAKALKPGTRRSSSDVSAYSRRLGLGNQGLVPAPLELSSGDVFMRTSDRPDQSPGKSTGKKDRSMLKRFLGIFSRKDREEEEEREPSPEGMRVHGATEGPRQPVPSRLTPERPQTGAGLPGEQDSQPGHTSMRKKRSLLRLPLHGHAPESTQTQRPPSFRILAGTGQTEAVVCVEPSGAYYEKVSKELERIVKEVKDSPVNEGQLTFAASVQNRASMVAPEDEETIEKIISLLKQQGDDINVEIENCSSVSSFFQSLSYRDFQQLADRYMEEEVPSNLPEVAAGPELVKFAFTLDFTAKVAGLANQAVSRIMGFGNQYLQDRFTQMSKVQVPVSQGEALQSFMDPD
ncbi:uncharacterized protein LOC133139298 [Conger conger]|uniref:uncharacterized protein LOC133139298 n=1 Tax=Conger conger TaxID=82655 RepID=UPI002A5ABF5E|nr:uncharacterized protein LOC133139298 [Conger conger]XP_061114721.1 uncharacterized protein LOC133139298 [Conger conger]